MYESRDMTGFNDHEGKTMKNSDVEEEEEEDTKEIAEERSSTSSNPTVVAPHDQEVSQEKIVKKPNGQEDVVTPIKKRGHLCISHSSRSDATSDSNFRHSIKRNKKELEGNSASTSLSNLVQDLSKLTPERSSFLTKTGSIAELNQKDFLFEKRLTHCDAKGFGLVIPKKTALAHLPSLETREGTFMTQVLQFVDFQNKKWSMKFILSPGSKSYRISVGWKEFATTHNLQAMDLIRVYKCSHPLHCNQYSIDLVKGKKTGTDTIQSPSEDCNQNGGWKGECSIVENENTGPVKDEEA